jgi:uncharacterized protein YjbI with pentapeptide repeats
LPFIGLLAFLFAVFWPVQFAYTQVSVPNPSAETKPHWDYAKLTEAVQAENVISDCSISGSDLSDLLIRTEAGNDSAHRLSSGIQLQNVDIEGAVTVTGGTVSLPVSFTGCNFTGAVNFDDTNFLHNLEILRSHFNGEFSAKRMHVGGDFIIRGSTFNAENQAFFNNAQIDGDLTWKNTKFLSQKGVNCARLSVSQDASISNVEFAGSAQFEHCLIGHVLTIENCQFEGSDESASFSSADIKEDLLVRSSRFAGSTRWDHIKARGLYFSDRTMFSKPLEFANLTIDRSMSLDTVETVADIVIRDSEISEDLRISDLKIKAGSEPEQRRARPGFHLLATKIKNLRLAGISISGKLDLEDDNIGTLDTGDYVPANDDQNQCKLVNVTVHSFETQNSRPGSLLDFVNSSGFDPEIYLCLEKFFASQGRTELADQTFIERNKRFEEVRPKDLGWLGQTIAGWLAGYGRDPKRSLIPCLLVVFIGWFVFADKTKMKVTDENFKDRGYNFWYAFWYSLDVFAPIIDLEAAKVWSPMPGQTFRWFFFRLERILGWLLVPIAIAAFTGFLHT